MDMASLLLDQAMRLERDGMRPQAEFLYRKILAEDSHHVGAALGLALSLFRSDRPDEGLEWMRKAAALAPDSPEMWHHLGTALAMRGEVAEAVNHYRRALALRPDFAEAAYSLGSALSALGQTAEAALAYEQAARLRPDSAEAHINWACALHGLGHFEEAASECRQAIVLNSAIPEAHNHLGAALVAMKNFEAAALSLRQAIALKPDYAAAHYNLGMALNELDRPAEAIEAYRSAIAFDPTLADAHINLGSALYAEGRMAEAAEAARSALAVAPHSATAHNNLALALHAQGRSEDALRALETAITIDPGFPDFHYHYGLVLLEVGRLSEGWAESEWRLKIAKFRRDLPFPPWRGEPLGGKTILLHTEQGLGDGLHFLRYAPVVAAKGGRVVVAVEKPLERIARTLPGIAGVVALDAPLPAADYALSLMSVPHVVGTSLETIPAAIPYLWADSSATAAWGGRLAALSGLKVGLVWAGNPRVNHKEAAQVDRRRSMRPEHLAPLAGIDGVTFISLQKGERAAEDRHMPPGLGMIDWMGEIGDFADTAALVANLDLVIAVDTSVAHLAGALGKPVWILSRFDGCWRWLRDRDDSPWYPSARLFRQKSPGDWAEVMARVAAALRALAESRRG